MWGVEEVLASHVNKLARSNLNLRWDEHLDWDGSGISNHSDYHCIKYSSLISFPTLTTLTLYPTVNSWRAALMQQYKEQESSSVSMSPCVICSSGHWPSCHNLQVRSENVLIKPYTTSKLRILMWQTAWQWTRGLCWISPLSPLEAIGYQIKLTTISLLSQYKFGFFCQPSL